MSDSKLNKKFRDAVRTGSRGTARTVRSTWKKMRIRERAGSTWQKMRLWQKIGLLLCLVFWIASVILGAACRKVTGGLIDQQAAERWAPGENYAQVSAFLADGSGASEETVKAMYTGLMLDLQSDAIALSETQVNNGASLVEECYCGMGSADISTSNDSVTANVIGVGGNFFNFHPLELLDGYYFADDDLMKDRVLLDDQTAWRLFGSPNVVGMAVYIGGTPHYIAGVFRQPTERFYKDSGMGSYLVYMSYDSLCKYTESSSASGEDDGTGEGGDNITSGMDALAPQPLPQSAAYMPVIANESPDKKAVESEEDAVEFDDSDDLGDSDSLTETVEEPEDSSDDKELNDDPIEGDFGTEDSSGHGSSGRDSDDEEGQAESVNRNRVSCYEVVMPNPVAGYALRKVRSRLEQIPFPMEKATVVDNTSRYDTLRLITLMAQPGVRSMQVAPIRYPYWENVALGWEDIMIPFAFLWGVLRFSPLVFLLCLLIWYATHKSWTVGGVVKNIQDKIYDRQSERIYGGKSAAALSAAGVSAIAADHSSGDKEEDRKDEETGPDDPAPEDEDYGEADGDVLPVEDGGDVPGGPQDTDAENDDSDDLRDDDSAGEDSDDPQDNDDAGQDSDDPQDNDDAGQDSDDPQDNDSVGQDSDDPQDEGPAEDDTDSAPEKSASAADTASES